MTNDEAPNDKGNLNDERPGLQRLAIGPIRHLSCMILWSLGTSSFVIGQLSFSSNSRSMPFAGGDDD